MCSLASVVLTASLSFCSSMGVFFFKQKTAYELRISDWSSDVCSSDLVRLALDGAEGGEIVMPDQPLGGQVHCVCIKVRENTPRKPCIQRQRRAAIDDAIFIRPPNAGKRSEEHTSELQSLMRNSYAVFCLKKKTHMISTH